MAVLKLRHPLQPGSARSSTKDPFPHRRPIVVRTTATRELRVAGLAPPAVAAAAVALGEEPDRVLADAVDHTIRVDYLKVLTAGTVPVTPRPVAASLSLFHFDLQGRPAERG